MTNAEGFFQLKLKQLNSKFNTEEAVLYRGFYNNIANKNLKEIFSIIHSRLNGLFTFMNHKNSSRGGHFNAVESRELIEINRQLSLIHATLRDEYSDYSFEINSSYKEILNNCIKFMSSDGGSSIPVDFQEINIIEHKPIFNLNNSIVIQGSEKRLSVNKKFIGGGSYANVYKYKDPHYNFSFAMKIAKEKLRADELERFKNEYKDLKSLDSPFIIKAYRYNEKNNEYTMELADYTLDKHINKHNNTLTYNERRALVIQLLNAFEYIHSKGFLHRDVSYQNILIKNYDDGSSWIKVCDFGLTKRSESTLTRQGTEIKGTLNDISDLNKIGFENYEIIHETYALAQVIYFILRGRKSRYDREENNELKGFILDAISAHKEKRFKSVNEMKDELTEIVLPSLRKAQSTVPT